MDTTTILIVDDEPGNLSLLTYLLRPFYQVRAANSGENALRVAASEPRPDLILLDVMMPGMDGEEVLSRVRTQLEAKHTRDWLKDKNAILEAEVSRRMVESDLTQLVSIRALARLAETRDPETGNHILRTQHYVRALALRLRLHPRFSALLDARTIDLLTKSAPLHDIGKVGIPDSILLKPGPLTAQEWAIMKTHSRLGSDAVEQAETDVEQPVAFLALAKEIAHWHHEKWDGSGYPDGLRGDAIPLSARLMAVADVFDALISQRMYKLAMSYDKAREIISEGSGSHFDPDIVASFLEGFDAMTAIADKYNERQTPQSTRLTDSQDRNGS